MVSHWSRSRPTRRRWSTRPRRTAFSTRSSSTRAARPGSARRSPRLRVAASAAAARRARSGAARPRRGGRAVLPPASAGRCAGDACRAPAGRPSSESRSARSAGSGRAAASCGRDRRDGRDRHPAQRGGAGRPWRGRRTPPDGDAADDRRAHVRVARDDPGLHVEAEIAMDAAAAAPRGPAAPTRRLTLPSFNDFVVRAAALALREHPALNASHADGRTIRHGSINIGVAVATEDALVVPVIHGRPEVGLRDRRRVDPSRHPRP